MKVEILTNSEFDDIIWALNTEAKCLYKTPEDIYTDYPYYEIWEIEKSDIRTIETACMFEDVMFCYSNGEHRGTPYDLVNINGVQIIGWLEGSKDDTFDCLIDYFRDCLGVTDSYEICAYSTYLAKTNGYTLAELWEKLQ